MARGPASVGAPAVAVVGGLVGLGFLGDGAALAALPGAALRERAEGEAGGECRGSTPCLLCGVTLPCLGPRDGPGQVLWATAPWQPPIYLSPAWLPGAGAASSTSQLHRLCPSTRPRLHTLLQASSTQGRGQQGERRWGRVGVGCVCAQMCVCTY